LKLNQTSFPEKVGQAIRKSSGLGALVKNLVPDIWQCLKIVLLKKGKYRRKHWTEEG
jgi:hypothetical protein